MGLASVLLMKFLRFVRAFLDVSSDFLFGLVNRGKTEFLPPISNLILLDSAETLATKIRTRKLTSREVVESYIERIKEVNPIVNAVVDDNFEQALRKAGEVDKFIESGEKDERQIAEETPFLGVPFTLKDCFSVRGLRQTVGLISRKDKVSNTDADVVVLMKAAGAIPLAVTNVSELCMWWESSNNVYGRTNNPYDTTRIVGGSSGGEGCIISSAGSVFGIGSDIGGSIRMPAFFNGIFGHKPSTGIVSNKGQLPLAEGDKQIFLTTGPMCRYATDLLPMLRVLASPNLHKLQLDKKVRITNINFFYMDSEGEAIINSKVQKDIKKAFAKVVYSFKKVHDIEVKKVDIPLLKQSFPIWSFLMGKEPPTFAEEMTERQGKIGVGFEFIKWLIRCSDHTLPAILLAVSEKFTHSEDYPKYADMCERLKREFEDMLGDDGVFLYPTHPRSAPYHHQPIIMPFNFTYTAIFNVLGFPATSCPLGLGTDGLPVGLQVVSNLNNDHLCLAVARELEKMFDGWVSPSTVL